MARPMKFGKKIPMTWVDDSVEQTIEYFMNTYNMSKSNAIRHILDNGIQYIAIFGDGIGEIKNER